MLLKRYSKQLLVAAGLLAVAAGCIISGQFTILINIDNQMYFIDDVLNPGEVDLTDNGTWEKHKDEIQNIVDVKFEMSIQNETSSEVTGQVYVSTTEYTTVGDVQDNATLVLSGIVIGANDTRDIKFSESSQYITNLQTLLDLVEGGKFWVYGIAKDAPYTIRILGGTRLLVTFSAG
jgi:hypothetical protein